jgi:hypothetical protein
MSNQNGVPDAAAQANAAAKEAEEAEQRASHAAARAHKKAKEATASAARAAEQADAARKAAHSIRLGFWKALFQARSEKPVELLGLVVGVLTLFIAGVTLWYLKTQLDDVRNTLESQAYSYIITSQLELDKVFTENSEYRQYFLNDEAPPRDDLSKMKKIWSLADMKLDVIDAFHSQAEHVNWLRYTRPAWDEFHKRSFRRSRVLCEAICNDWAEYGNRVRSLALSECDKQKMQVPDPANAAKGCKWVP